MIQILLDNQLTVDKLAERLDISKRTAFRYIHFLREHDLPIQVSYRAYRKREKEAFYFIDSKLTMDEFFNFEFNQMSIS